MTLKHFAKCEEQSFRPARRPSRTLKNMSPTRPPGVGSVAAGSGAWKVKWTGSGPGPWTFCGEACSRGFRGFRLRAKLGVKAVVEGPRARTQTLRDRLAGEGR